VLNFNHLYYFHVTAEEGSVKAAAERLGVTQPTVSEQIRMLERSLGVPLFERTTTGLRLTDRGREAFEHTTTMFLAGERLATTLGHRDPATPLVLRVGLSAAVARTVAADFLMPLLTVEDCLPSIRTGDFTDLLRQLRSHEIDLMIGEAQPIDAARPNIDLVVLHRPRLVAVARPDLEARDNWQDLAMLEYGPGSAYHWEVDNFLRERGLRPRLVGTVDDAFLILEGAARGGFVGFVPSSVARPAIRAGRVKELAAFRPGTAGVYALFHSGSAPDLARTAVDKLIENARQLFDEPD